MIKIEGLSKFFRTEEVETIALNGVSMEVKDGEFVAIMGFRLWQVHLAEYPGPVGHPTSATITWRTGKSDT